MKALVLEEYKRFEYKDVPMPEVEPDSVLVQVKTCGICGSDVHGMDGSTGRRQPPIIMGHEAAGVITEIGENVKGWKVGDRVTFDSTIYCGTCWFCRRGDINLCDNRMVLGVSCDDYRRHGAFAEYVSIPQHILYRLPDDLSFEDAAMVEAVSIAVHAVGRTHIKLNDSAVVVGTGMIGLLVVQALKAAGCGQVIAVDVDQSRLDMALKLGATHSVKADDPNANASILELTEGRGADVACEVVGATPTIKQALSSIRKGGTLILVGNLAPTVELPLQSAVTREISILGTCASSGEYPACLDLIARGDIQVKPLISAVAPLSEGQSWFDRLYTREPGLMKVILTP